MGGEKEGGKGRNEGGCVGFRLGTPTQMGWMWIGGASAACTLSWRRRRGFGLAMVRSLCEVAAPAGGNFEPRKGVVIPSAWLRLRLHDRCRLDGPGRQEDDRNLTTTYGRMIYRCLRALHIMEAAHFGYKAFWAYELLSGLSGWAHVGKL